MLEKLKSFLSNDAVFYGLLLIFVSVASFGLGRQSVEQGISVKSVAKQGDLLVAGPAPTAPAPTPLKPTPATPTAPVTTPTPAAGEVVASKTGSKYHLPTCPGAKQIKPENLISFASASAAEASGYTPAANCKGLQ